MPHTLKAEVIKVTTGETPTCLWQQMIFCLCWPVWGLYEPCLCPSLPHSDHQSVGSDHRTGDQPELQGNSVVLRPQINPRTVVINMPYNQNHSQKMCQFCMGNCKHESVFSIKNNKMLSNIINALIQPIHSWLLPNLSWFTNYKQTETRNRIWQKAKVVSYIRIFVF